MEHFEGNNIGGLLSIEICLHKIPTGYNPVTFPSGHNWLNIPFNTETGELNPDAKDSENGNIHSYAGRFFLHRLRPEFKEQLNIFLGKRSILRLTDMNGETYIIGSPDCPALLELNSGTGRKFASTNGAEYIFKCEMPFEALTA